MRRTLSEKRYAVRHETHHTSGFRNFLGDEQGWDPGSRALPIGIGFVRLGLSVYLVYRESVGREAEKPVPAGPRRLILLNIGVSILFILAFRGLGFILSTHILLFTLIYFNHYQDVSGRLLPRFFAGLVPGLVAAGTTELLFLVFRQIFFVNLARGIIFW